MYTEEELLPLSGLQHLTYCERRWALVQIEWLWEENKYTAEGRALHDRAHSNEIESRPGVLIRRTLPLRSFRLGISGQADIVEFAPAAGTQIGLRFEGRRGYWLPFPIEYKRRKGGAGSDAYRVQLCAQAMCLEEMLQVEVAVGALYDGTTKRRTHVEFTAGLRSIVEHAAARIHELHRLRLTPAPVYAPACGKCSMQEVCQPKALSDWPSVAQYMATALAAASLE